MNFTNTTDLIVKIIPPKVIIFSVSARNIVGNGRESSVTSELILISISFQIFHYFKLYIYSYSYTHKWPQEQNDCTVVEYESKIYYYYRVCFKITLGKTRKIRLY